MAESFTLIRTSVPATGGVYRRNLVGDTVVDLIVNGSGSVSASAKIEGSNNGYSWVDIGTINASGTDKATGFSEFKDPWAYLRGTVTSVTGTNAIAQINSTASEIEAANGGHSVLSVWTRVTGNTVANERYVNYDVFPSINNVTITLPDPSAYPDARIDVWNQTNTSFNVAVKNHLGMTLKTILPTHAYSFYYDYANAVVPWESVKLDGQTVVSLSVANYGDFNSLNWDSLPSGDYSMTGLGSEFTNLPTDTVLLPLSSYTYNIKHVNVSGDYYDTVFFTSSSDFTNNYLGRPCTRAGTNFGSATSVGWRILGYKAELTYSLDAQRRSATNIAIPTTNDVIFVWDTLVNEFGASAYNTTTGVFTCPFTGAYTFTFRFNVRCSSGTRQFCAGAEIWNGSSWVKAEYSAVVEAVRSGEERQAIFVSPVRFTAGTQVRFPFWCDGNITIANSVPNNGAGFTVPASRLMILGVESK